MGLYGYGLWWGVALLTFPPYTNEPTKQVYTRMGEDSITLPSTTDATDDNAAAAAAAAAAAEGEGEGGGKNANEPAAMEMEN